VVGDENLDKILDTIGHHAAAGLLFLGSRVSTLRSRSENL